MKKLLLASLLGFAALTASEGPIFTPTPLQVVTERFPNTNMIFSNRPTTISSGKTVFISKIPGSNNSAVQAVIVRYNQDGTLDSTFGDRGVLITEMPDENTFIDEIIEESSTKKLQ